MALKNFLQAGVLAAGSFLGTQNIDAQIPPHPDDVKLPVTAEVIGQSTKRELHSLLKHEHRGVRHAAADELEERIHDYTVDELIDILTSDLFAVRQAASKEIIQKAVNQIEQEKKPLPWKHQVQALLSKQDTELRERGSSLLHHINNIEDRVRINGTVFSKNPEWKEGQKQPLSVVLQRLEVCGNTRFNTSLFDAALDTPIEVPKDGTLFWEAFDTMNLSSAYNDVGCIYLQEKPKIHIQPTIELCKQS